MKVLVASLAVSSCAAFSVSPFACRSSSALLMADYDLDFGKNNDYVTQSVGDGGQGQFGAVSPNNWRVPGTSPVGQSSYAGAPDGGDEPWFSEAISTVSLDLGKAEDTLKAFTREAAMFKISEFAASKPYGFTSPEAAMDELVGKIGYTKFLESSTKQLTKTWAQLYPPPKEEKKEKKEKKEAKKE